jgi:hypothetical protein
MFDCEEFGYWIAETLVGIRGRLDVVMMNEDEI